MSGRPMSSRQTSGGRRAPRRAPRARSCTTVDLRGRRASSSMAEHLAGVDVVVDHQDAQRRRRRRPRCRRRGGGVAAGRRAARGRRTRERGCPCPAPSLAAATLPPCSSTRLLTSARPMPEAALRAVGRALGLGEQVEHARQQLGRDADAVVAHRACARCPRRRCDARAAMRRLRACTWRRCSAGWRRTCTRRLLVALHERGRRRQLAASARWRRASISGRTCSTAASTIAPAASSGAASSVTRPRVTRETSSRSSTRPVMWLHLARDDLAGLAHPGVVRRPQLRSRSAAGADRRQRIAQLVRQHGQELVLAAGRPRAARTGGGARAAPIAPR